MVLQARSSITFGMPRIAILTEGRTDPIAAKTALSLLRFRTADVVALIDSHTAGQVAGEPLRIGDDVGGTVPIVAGLGAAAELGPVDELVIGVATAGGVLPPALKDAVLEACRRGLRVISGLHDFLVDDPEIVAAARAGGAELCDVRRNGFKKVADREGLDASCLKIHTVGQDCSVGKMMTALELTRGLQAAGADAKFVATGQTGIMIEGDGCPVDCVVSDFVNGAAEQLVKDHQHHDVIVIEGQATLVHPAYSAVTFGLLHGALPDALILCYEADRPHMTGRPHLPLTPLDQLRELYERVCDFPFPIGRRAEVIGVSLNARRLSGADAIAAEKHRVGELLGLPVCDVWTDGPQILIDAVDAFASRTVGKRYGGVTV